MSEFLYKVIAIDSMYDGDSVNVRVFRSHHMKEQVMDFGFGDVVVIPGYFIEKTTSVKVRMYGFDTTELRDNRPDWKAAAYLARDVGRAWMDARIAADELMMHTFKDGTGKFGRYLANFWTLSDQGDSLGRLLMGQNLAVPYHGQNKSEVEAAHASNIALLRDAGRI